MRTTKEKPKTSPLTLASTERRKRASPGRPRVQATGSGGAASRGAWEANTTTDASFYILSPPNGRGESYRSRGIRKRRWRERNELRVKCMSMVPGFMGETRMNQVAEGESRRSSSEGHSHPWS